MSKSNKELNKIRRQQRVRSTIIGTSKRPRLRISISNGTVRAQIIDDSKGITLVNSDGRAQKGNLSDVASWVGTDIATKAKTTKIKKVVFDRGDHIYHGRPLYPGGY